MKILFVGGPRDGEKHWVDDPYPGRILVVPLIEPVPIKPLSDDPPVFNPARRAIYQLNRFDGVMAFCGYSDEEQKISIAVRKPSEVK